MHTYCHTEKAVVLVGCLSEQGPLRVPSNSPDEFGLVLEVNTNNLINEQIVEAIIGFFGDESLRTHIEINQSYTDEVFLKDSSAAKLYLASLKKNLSDKEGHTMPDLLRSMPKNRRRLPYLRAWQVFSGGLETKLDILDFDPN